VSTSASILQEETSIDEFFNVMATETLALFEHLEFDFLEEFDVFAPARRGRTRDHHPPALFRAFLHCYYKNVYGIRPVTRELQNTVVWLSCGFDRPPSRDAVDRFLTDLEHVVDEVFDRLVEQAACRGLLDLTYSIDSTDVRDDARRPRRVERLRSNRRRVLPRLRLYDRLDRAKDPDCRGVHREQASARGETAMRVTCDALAVEKPIWMLGDSAYDTLGWHDHLLAAGVVPVAPYNARNTDDPKDIEYRVEARIDEHSEDVQLKQSTLDETYNRRSGVERTNDAVKDCGLGHVRARGRVHARAQVFLALCLRLVIAITNDERGDNPGSTVITL